MSQQLNPQPRIAPVKTPRQVTVEGSGKELVVYVRSECHLCEDMVDQLHELQAEHTFEMELRDVDSRPDWLNTYGEKVPVLLAEDVEVCRYFLDLQAVRQVLGTVSRDTGG